MWPLRLLSKRFQQTRVFIVKCLCYLVWCLWLGATSSHYRLGGCKLIPPSIWEHWGYILRWAGVIWKMSQSNCIKDSYKQLDRSGPDRLPPNVDSCDLAVPPNTLCSQGVGGSVGNPEFA